MAKPLAIEYIIRHLQGKARREVLLRDREDTNTSEKVTNLLQEVFDLEKAKASGDLMVKMVEGQPAMEGHFLLHVNGDTGDLVPDGPDDLRLFYRLLNNEPQELFFQLGYPVYFLHQLYQVTKEDKYLNTADRILQFVQGCHQGFYTNFFHHKVAWGAALMTKTKGNDSYRVMCRKCVHFLLSLQTKEGDLLRDLGTQVSLDQSAEIPIWLCEMHNALVDSLVL
ncbi:hypothetical protein ACOMHN_062025 [Nucella lapillus]